LPLIDLALGPAPVLVATNFRPSQEIAAEFDEWYRKEHIPLLRRIPGYRRTRRYKVLYATKLNEFNRAIVQPPTYLAIQEFELGEGDSFEGGLLMKHMREADDTEWARKISSNLSEIDSGFWKLKRAYGEWAVQDAKL
jgi:hypothetical protein